MKRKGTYFTGPELYAMFPELNSLYEAIGEELIDGAYYRDADRRAAVRLHNKLGNILGVKS